MVNVDPFPSSLSTVIDPPSSSAHRLAIGNPSPVPWRPCASRGNCLNSSKISSRASAAIPTPVSATAITRRASPRAPLYLARTHHHLASFGKLNRVAQEIEHDLSQSVFVCIRFPDLVGNLMPQLHPRLDKGNHGVTARLNKSLDSEIDSDAPPSAPLRSSRDQEDR